MLRLDSDFVLKLAKLCRTGEPILREAEGWRSLGDRYERRDGQGKVIVEASKKKRPREKALNVYRIPAIGKDWTMNAAIEVSGVVDIKPKGVESLEEISRVLLSLYYALTDKATFSGSDILRK